MPEFRTTINNAAGFFDPSIDDPPFSRYTDLVRKDGVDFHALLGLVRHSWILSNP